jgi:hypothetical protein
MKSEGLSEEQLSEEVFWCCQLIISQPFYQLSDFSHLYEHCFDLYLYHATGKKIRPNQLEGKFDRDGLVEDVIWHYLVRFIAINAGFKSRVAGFLYLIDGAETVVGKFKV